MKSKAVSMREVFLTEAVFLIVVSGQICYIDNRGLRGADHRRYFRERAALIDAAGVKTYVAYDDTVV